MGVVQNLAGSEIGLIGSAGTGEGNVLPLSNHDSKPVAKVVMPDTCQPRATRLDQLPFACKPASAQ